jgi:hypothetical protein
MKVLGHIKMGNCISIIRDTYTHTYTCTYTHKHTHICIFVFPKVGLLEDTKGGKEEKTDGECVTLKYITSM